MHFHTWDARPAIGARRGNCSALSHCGNLISDLSYDCFVSLSLLRGGFSGWRNNKQVRNYKITNEDVSNIYYVVVTCPYYLICGVP